MEAGNDRVRMLSDILGRLNSGENPESVRRQAKALIDTMNAAELSMAEQALVDEGLPQEQLRGLCSVHMEMLQSELERFKASVPPGHVLHTLIEEHDLILGFLDGLEDVNGRIQKETAYDDGSLDELAHLGHHLTGAEKHHKREEDVLFAELEARLITGPPRIMRMEHDDIRPMKHRIEELADMGRKRMLDFGKFKEELKELVPRLVFTLRDHIFKENNILYPTAIEVLQDEELWEDMRLRCDGIGYCCFTPRI